MGGAVPVVPVVGVSSVAQLANAWRHSLCGWTPSSAPVSTPPEGADRGFRAGPVGPRTALSVVAGRFGD
ncbi:hypothetical protein Spla01_02892 [Streptomyces platensis]|uniref:Uncharacterized protein n=1 Tax=Streptomyces platensis TaxID=58346 RepID=A0ABX3Y1Q4_STRPT|nr:hypothetical protein BG653_01472 [Streptomyces platensis]